MKKCLSFIIALVLVLALCSCVRVTQNKTAGKKTENKQDEEIASDITRTDSPKTAQPYDTQTETDEPVAEPTETAALPTPAETALPYDTHPENPDEILVGTWETKKNVLVGELTVTYTFYPDGTCVQSTDLNQTSRWIFTDDSHVKVTTPLNFTEVYELSYENGVWHLTNGSNVYVKR